MKYDDDMMVELIVRGELSHAKIAEKVGVSRRTVWQVANGLSRPDLQRRIADAADGMRQAAIRYAAQFTEALLKKQNEDGHWGSPVNTGFAILTLGVPYRYLPIYQK